MKYYVVSDVHGFYTELVRALDTAGFFRETEPHKLIVCGDAFDRGKEAVRLSEFLMRLLSEDRLIYILGNHEDLLVRCLQEIAHGEDVSSGIHVRNGTLDTILQLCGIDRELTVRYPSLLVSEMRETPLYKTLLNAAEDYYETDRYIFCHGYIPVRVPNVPPYEMFRYDPQWRQASVKEWQGARWLNGMDVACRCHAVEAGKTIVCGHWHTSYAHALFEQKGTEFGVDADFSPFYADGIIALDACTAHSGFVNCIVLED